MFRQLARPTEKYSIRWDPPLEAVPVTEDMAPQIGVFLLRLGHPLHRDCEPGTLRGPTYYVTRLFDYHRNDPNFVLSLQASTLVRDRVAGQPVGVCLVGGGGPQGDEHGIYDIVVDPAHRNRKIGTHMIQLALTILAESGISEFHLWREDDSRAALLYARLGFEPTGRVE